MRFVMKNIADLKAANYNPRKLSNEQCEQLMTSMQQFGVVEPAVVNVHKDRSNVIVGGHQRIEVARKIGWKEFPCVEVCLEEGRERELNVRLNKNTGEFDFDKLLQEFEISDLLEWGFDESELAVADMEELGGDGVGDLELSAAEVFVPGDVWRLGRHELTIGKAKRFDDLEGLFEDWEGRGGKSPVHVKTGQSYQSMRK